MQFYTVGLSFVAHNKLNYSCNLLICNGCSTPPPVSSPEHTRKYDRNELHWLSVPHRVKFKLGTMMFRCLRLSVPWYLSDFCTPVANVAARTTVRQTSSSRRSTLQQVHVRPPRLLCSWFDDLELTLRQYA